MCDVSPPQQWRPCNMHLDWLPTRLDLRIAERALLLLLAGLRRGLQRSRSLFKGRLADTQGSMESLRR